MAIDYSGFARAYAGPTPDIYANMGNQLAQAWMHKAAKNEQEKALGITQGYQDLVGQDFMSGNAMTMISKDPKDWGDISGLDIENPLTSYLSWKQSLSPEQKLLANKQGLLDPIRWKQQHDAYMAMIAPQIAEKILSYQKVGNKSNAEMREFIEKHGLTNFIDSNFRDEMNPIHSALRGWTTEPVPLGQQFKDLAQSYTTGWTPGGALGTGAAGAGALGYGGYKAFQSGKFDADKWKIPGMGGRKGLIFGSEKTVQKIGKELMPTGGQTSEDILDRARSQYKSMQKAQGGPGVNNKQGKNLKQTIKKLETRVAREIKRPTNVKDAKALWTKLTKQFGGKSGVIKALWTKAGPQKALAIMSRLGLGLAGTVIPEGITTVAGIAMTGYTLYQLAELLLSE